MADTLPQTFTPETQAKANVLPAVGMATIDAPQFDDQGQGKQLDLTARSIKNIEHAYNICKQLEVNNRTRAMRTADIQELYDGVPPRSASGQAERGKSWQSNASTGWLAGIVGRVSQRFVNSVISQTYVSSSALPESIPDYKTKTDLMRSRFTRLVRSWEGYTGLINALSVENSLQGYTYSVFLDPYTWKPTMFKQDRAFVPESSGQHARDLQFFVAKMDYRLDEFLALVRDEEKAKEVGYDLENCFKAASQATMQDPRTDALTTRFRSLTEMQNEGILGLTYTNSGARVVNTWLLFNREYDGRVSFWLIDRDNGLLLRFSYALFKSMEDVMAMFSFEPGNGTIHSSKGLGRKLAALTIMKEIFRNGIIDNARMSGLMVLRADSKDKTKFAPVVMAPFIVIDKGIDIAQTQFNVNGDSYRIVDNLIDAWAEQSVGAYMTQQIDPTGKTEKTATEASIDARRESEAADIMIRRWLDQFSTMTQIQQERAFSDENIAEAKRLYTMILTSPELDTPELYENSIIGADLAKVLVEFMQFGITEDEIKMWRESPASMLAHVGEGAIQQGMGTVKQLFSGNPNVDQGQLDYKILEGLVGADLAKQLFIPKADETLTSESTRSQIIESAIMTQSGIPLPVSSRDNHVIHGAVIQEMLTKVAAPALSNPNPPPQVLKAAELNLNHLGEHLKDAAMSGQDKSPQIKELEKFYNGFKKQLSQVVQINANASFAQGVMEQAVRSGIRPGEQTQATQPPANAQMTETIEQPLASANEIPTTANQTQGIQ